MTEKIQRCLLLARHAKAAEDLGGGDHARPLSVRGQQDAGALGDWLEAHALQPQQVFCSTARRTRETLAALGANLPTILRDKMYLASAGELFAQVQGADDAVTNLMLVGHNPGMHGLLAMLVADYAHEQDVERVAMKFPTAACAVLQLKLDHWRDLVPHSATLLHLRWSADN